MLKKKKKKSVQHTAMSSILFALKKRRKRKCGTGCDDCEYDWSFDALMIVMMMMMMNLQLATMQTPAVMGMMLVNRKTSYKDGMPLADYGPDENLNDNADIEWVNKNWVSRADVLFSNTVSFVFCWALCLWCCIIVFMMGCKRNWTFACLAYFPIKL